MRVVDPLWNRISVVALCAAAALSSEQVYAQERSAQADALQEVVVTAKRRNEDVQTTSLSATVLPQELLEDKGVVDLYALQYAAPAITVTQYGSANVFNIRGLGRSQVDIDVPSGVVIYRDGTPTLAGYFQNEPYFDMKSVEVYRGPQGTFVGKNAAGGAVFISTNDPELGELNGSVELGGANYSAIEGTGIVNVPIGDTTALRLAYRHNERDHFYDSITGDFTGHPGEVDNNSFRLGFLWEPSENFSAVFKVDYHDLDFGGNVTTVFGEDPLGNVEQNADFAYTDESTRAVLNLKYKFANGVTLNSLTGHQDIESVNNLDVNATVPLYYEFHSRIDAKFFSQEVNLVSPDDQAFRWALGLFFQNQDSELPPWQQGGFNFLGNGFPPDFPWATSPWDNEEEDRAIFAHGGYRLTDRVELEAGIRYGEYERNQFTEWFLDSGAAPPVTPWPGTTPGGDRQSISEDSFDWQTALNFEVSKDRYLYGLISRGHITGGINIFPPFVIYDEMAVTNYEVGWKERWAGETFNTQFTVYYETFDDYQANFAETIAGLNFPTNRNAETESTVWGIELSGQARVGAFSLDFGFAYSESELGTFSDVVDPFRTAPNNIVNLSGAKVPFSPEVTGNIGMAYDFKLGTLTLTPRMDFSHVDETQAALWDTPMVTLPSRDLINAQIALRPDSDKWSAVLWGTNITDEHYISGIQNNATLYYAAPPGQYGLRVKLKF
jgi:iron complex outermembrane receptor protein